MCCVVEMDNFCKNAILKVDNIECFLLIFVRGKNQTSNNITHYE